MSMVKSAPFIVSQRGLLARYAIGISCTVIALVICVPILPYPSALIPVLLIGVPLVMNSGFDDSALWGTEAKQLPITRWLRRLAFHIAWNSLLSSLIIGLAIGLDRRGMARFDDWAIAVESLIGLTVMRRSRRIRNWVY